MLGRGVLSRTQSRKPGSARGHQPTCFDLEHPVGHVLRRSLFAAAGTAGGALQLAEPRRASYTVTTPVSGSNPASIGCSSSLRAISQTQSSSARR